MRYSFCPNRSNHKLKSKRGKVEIKKSRNVWKDTRCCNQTWPLASSLLQKSPPLTNQAQCFQSPSHRGNPGADKRRHRCQGMLCASRRKRFPSLFKAEQRGFQRGGVSLPSASLSFSYEGHGNANPPQCESSRAAPGHSPRSAAPVREPQPETPSSPVSERKYFSLLLYSS